MAKKSAAKTAGKSAAGAGKPAGRTGKSLVIVESPAKARTISKFLGPNYIIEASIGHVRDLPQGAKQIPAEFKGEDWAYLGVNVNKDFDPVYIIPPGKTQQVRKLKGLLKDAQDLYLATDEDREGEAISWHLRELLQPKVPVKRLVFHEITSEAIHEALEHPRDIDDDLVKAQETRRIVDRLYGYEVSPLLWRKVRPRLSAGRVQSVAVRLIVERERERMAFVSASYWDLLGVFAKRTGETLAAGMNSYQNRRVPAAKDFDAATGRLKDPGLLLLNAGEATALANRLKPLEFRVASIDDKPYTTKPYPPFTTSTLQQEGNRKLGFTARRTMQVAQSLYENGHITYMRTDSTNLATVAIEAARELVKSQYGPDYLPAEARQYRTKVKNAQEAHEAIRPAGSPFALPETLRSTLGVDEFRLYDLIWKRTVASQMADARGRRISITIEGGEAAFQVGGKTIDFAGYLRAYVEGADDPAAEIADKETVLPDVRVGETLSCRAMDPKEHNTQPPARYNEPTLTRALEELGIGRPSTYAVIMETIQAREYVVKRGNALVPTWVAFSVAQLLEEHLPYLVDYRFTAQMEDDLDAISRGERKQLDYLKTFYFGGPQNGNVEATQGLKQQLLNKAEQIDARDISRIRLGTPPGGEEIFVRVGRYGPFLEQGERRASIPESVLPDELTLDASLKLLDQAAEGDKPLGHDPASGKPIYVKTGRFGPYVQMGDADGEEKPKNASFLKGMTPEGLTVELALKLLSLPRDLGPAPTTGEKIMVYNGRFGPYIKSGEETRSLPSDISPIDVTFEKAVELLAQPKQQRRGFGAQKEPLKVLGPSPVTKQEVKLLEGRYGPYVSDGVGNASIPKQQPIEEVTLEMALELLAARALVAPPPKAKRKTAAPKKSPAAGAKGAKKGTKKAAKKKAAEPVADEEA